MVIEQLSLDSLNAERMALFYRGLSSFKQPEQIMRAEVSSHIQNHAILAGPHSFCILYVPDGSALEQVVQVLHFYSEGGRAETRALVDAVLNWVKQKGYNTLRAVNGSGRRDDVWARTFRHKDWKQTPVKTVYDFEVKK